MKVIFFETNYTAAVEGQNNNDFFNSKNDLTILMVQ